MSRRLIVRPEAEAEAELRAAFDRYVGSKYPSQRNRERRDQNPKAYLLEGHRPR